MDAIRVAEARLLVVPRKISKVAAVNVEFHVKITRSWATTGRSVRSRPGHVVSGAR